MRLPDQYRYLERETGPRILLEALKLYGTLEAPGNNNNPTILGWAKEVGLEWLGIQYAQDSIPWCGLFMAICAKRAGLKLPRIAVRASQWGDWGNPVSRAMLGDVLVFTRTGGGHVGIYVGDDSSHYHVLGGNQRDMVNIIRIAKSRCTAIRRTDWNFAQPKNVRQITLAASGTISENES